MNQTKVTWLSIAFILSFFAAGIPYWLISYNRAGLSNALMGPGLTMALWSAVLGLAGVLPLLLYVAFGSSDGNPIGLGLLAVVAVPVAGVGLAIALIKMLAQHFVRREE